MRKDADAKDRDEGIVSTILKERSLTDALCSRSIRDVIVKVAETPEQFYYDKYKERAFVIPRTAYNTTLFF